jgi:hypothetical protein
MQVLNMTTSNWRGRKFGSGTRCSEIEKESETHRGCNCSWEGIWTDLRGGTVDSGEGSLHGLNISGAGVLSSLREGLVEKLLEIPLVGLGDFVSQLLVGISQNLVLRSGKGALTLYCSKGEGKTSMRTGQDGSKQKPHIEKKKERERKKIVQPVLANLRIRVIENNHAWT